MRNRFYAAQQLLFICTIIFSSASAAPSSRFAETMALSAAAAAAEDWATSADIYARLSRQSPSNGQYWYRLGRAQQALGRLEDALSSFAKAADLGFEKARTTLLMASIQARRGNAESAVELFEQSRALHLTDAERALQQDPALAALLTELRWQARLLPKLDDAAERLDKWNADLGFLDKRIRESHWQLFAQVDKQHWESELARLRSDLPALADWQVSVRLMELVRLGRSGHTHMIPPLQGKDAFHAADIRLRSFADGWFVTAAPDAHSELLGRRVLKIGSGDPDSVLARLSAVIPHDSPTGLRWIGGHFLTIPELLMHYGYADARDQLTLTLARVDGGDEVINLPAALMSGATLQGWMQYAEAPPSWKLARATSTHPTPLWLRHTDQNFWLEPELQHGLLYAQLNAVRDGETESLASFASRLQQALAAERVQGLILDLRNNHGGNGELATTLVQALIATPKLHEKGNFYVLISGQTFSAAVLLIADLERQLDPIFVGESTAAGPTHVGEDNMILLPNTGNVVLAATRLFVRSFSDDYRHAIAPQISAPLRFADYRKNLDTVMQAIAADRVPSTPSDLGL